MRQPKESYCFFFFTLSEKSAEKSAVSVSVVIAEQQVNDDYQDYQPDSAAAAVITAAWRCWRHAARLRLRRRRTLRRTRRRAWRRTFLRRRTRRRAALLSALFPALLFAAFHALSGTVRAPAFPLFTHKKTSILFLSIICRSFEKRYFLF